MKILVVVPSLGQGGAERVVSLLTRKWQEEHEVIVAVLYGQERAYEVGGLLVDLASPASSGVFRSGIRIMSRVRRVAGILAAEHPDRVISFLETASIPTVLASMLRRQRSALTISVRNNPATIPWFHRLAMGLLYRFPSRIVAVSRGVAASLAKTWPSLAGRIVVIPNPVDQVLIAKGVAGKTVVGSAGGDGYLLAVGRLVHQKGFDRLIEAFAALRGRSEKILIIAGEGPERPALQALAARLGVAERVRLPGNLSNPFALMSQAELFVLPSRWEGWPNALLEAMACRCPVIAFDCPYGPGEIIRHERSGLLVPEGDTPALAAALERLLADGRLRQELGRNARERARAFDVEHIAAQWLPPSGGGLRLDSQFLFCVQSKDLRHRGEQDPELTVEVECEKRVHEKDGDDHGGP
ncbi:MAG: glycosyltransferase [Acidobacteriota bacterium]